MTLKIPDHPIQRRLDGRAVARIWEIRGRAEDLLRDRDPDIARLSQALHDEAAAEAVPHTFVLARALWMVVGIRAALRDETTHIAKALGRAAQPMRTHFSKDTPAPRSRRLRNCPPPPPSRRTPTCRPLPYRLRHLALLGV